MAYNKKYAELGESVIDYVNDREDAIEEGFDTLITGGTNSDGSWIKFPDGTMICYRSFSHYPVSFPGGSTSSLDFTFPQSFVGDKPVVTGGGMLSRSGGLQVTGNLDFRGFNTNTVRVVVYPSQNIDEIRDLGYVAVGRWK